MADKQKPAPAGASFLNLDLELQSSTDLAPLAHSLGGRVVVLHCGEVEGGFRLVLELVMDGTLNGEPVVCTEHMLHLLEGLSPEQAALWRACVSRTFDYGFCGGSGAHPLHVDIGTVHLDRMARLGLAVRMTMYPIRADEPVEPSDAKR